jgi:hypothetical protein
MLAVSQVITAARRAARSSRSSASWTREIRSGADQLFAAELP